MRKSLKRIVALLLSNLLLIQAIWSTGCVRVLGELDALDHSAKNTERPCAIPPERFFWGTRNFLDESILFTIGGVFPPLILELPLETIADVVMLPFDSIIYSYYLVNPPLGLLIEKKENDMLEKKLKKGANPNRIDYRHHEWRQRYPIEFAYFSNNAEAGRLLIEYGATLPHEDIDFLSGKNQGNEEKSKIALYLLKSKIPKEMHQDKQARFYVNNWVRKWIKKRIASDSKANDGELEYEAISLLLKQGFPVNSFDRDQYSLFPKMTVLDEVLMAKRLNSEDKQRMVELLRSYNAKTYSECAKEDGTLPRSK